MLETVFVEGTPHDPRLILRWRSADGDVLQYQGSRSWILR